MHPHNMLHNMYAYCVLDKNQQIIQSVHKHAPSLHPSPGRVERCRGSRWGRSCAWAWCTARPWSRPRLAPRCRPSSIWPEKDTLPYQTTFFAANSHEERIQLYKLSTLLGVKVLYTLFCPSNLFRSACETFQNDSIQTHVRRNLSARHSEVIKFDCSVAYSKDLFLGHYSASVTKKTNLGCEGRGRL